MMSHTWKCILPTTICNIYKAEQTKILAGSPHPQISDFENRGSARKQINKKAGLLKKYINMICFWHSARTIEFNFGAFQFWYNSTAHPLAARQ